LISDRALRERLGHAGLEWARRNCWLQSANLLFNPAHTPEPTPLPF
jgi:phosphatidylinositol alpha-1,6-mannosyltransferase